MHIFITFFTDSQPQQSIVNFYDNLIKLLGTAPLATDYKPNSQDINNLLRTAFSEQIKPPVSTAICKEEEVSHKSTGEKSSDTPPPIPKLWLSTKQNLEYPHGMDYIARSLDKDHVEYSIIHNERVEKEIVDLQSDENLRKVILRPNGTIDFITNKEIDDMPDNIMVFPIPGLNETIAPETQLDTEILFPVVSKSLRIFPVYQKALRYLELIRYQAIDHVKPSKLFVSTGIAASDDDKSTSAPMKRRKIKLLEHNLSHLLATKRAIPHDVMEFFENYLKALQFADATQEQIERRHAVSSTPIDNAVTAQNTIKIINLTDYLLSTLNANVIPRQLSGHLDDLYDYLLVELNNDDLSDFFPKTMNKSGFILELFDFLQESKMVDGRVKSLIDMFRPFVIVDTIK